MAIASSVRNAPAPIPNTLAPFKGSSFSACSNSRIRLKSIWRIHGVSTPFFQQTSDALCLSLNHHRLKTCRHNHVQTCASSVAVQESAAAQTDSEVAHTDYGEKKHVVLPTNQSSDGLVQIRHTNPLSLHAKQCVSKASSGWQAGSTKFTEESCKVSDVCRREVLLLPISFLSAYIFNGATERAALATEFADMPALRGKDYGKSKMRYPDYLETDSGLQYKDLRIGMGSMPKPGETVVVDWDGYTIGYYGRIFEARNKAKGGSFEGNEKDYLKIKLGNNEVIPAFEEALATMNIGSVRRIIVPPELGYPDNDYNKRGPRPTTFSGQRALDFVLRNQGLIDKTLLFDIELLKIYPS